MLVRYGHLPEWGTFQAAWSVFMGDLKDYVCVCPGDLKDCVCVCLPVISKALGVCLGGTGLDRSEPMQTLSGEKPCHLPCLVPGPSGDLQRLLQSKPGPASLC